MKFKTAADAAVRTDGFGSALVLGSPLVRFAEVKFNLKLKGISGADPNAISAIDTCRFG